MSFVNLYVGCSTPWEERKTTHRKVFTIRNEVDLPTIFVRTESETGNHGSSKIEVRLGHQSINTNHFLHITSAP